MLTRKQMKLINRLKSFAHKLPITYKKTGCDAVDNTKNVRNLCVKYWREYQEYKERRAKLIEHYYGKPSFTSSEDYFQALFDHFGLAKLDYICNQKRDHALLFFRQHPEAWQQGDEIAYFYDSDKLQEQIRKTFNVELDYMKDLLSNIDTLDAKLNIATNANDAKAIEKIQNERSYLVAVLDDARRTMGDKIHEMWWNAIPDVIKQKYAKAMDDKMVQILAENNDLTLFVLNFYVSDPTLKVCRRFVKNLEKEFNRRIFTDPKQRVQFAVATRSDFDCSGNYTYDNQKIAIRFDDFSYSTIDEMINTVKHECLGHHVDNVLPTFGLQGNVMQDFVKELFNGKLVTHGKGEKFFPAAKSPLLQQHYCVDGMTEDEKSLLAKQGWNFFEEADDFEFEKYHAIFTERSAFSLEQTGDYANKIGIYRQRYMEKNLQNTK